MSLGTLPPADVEPGFCKCGCGERTGVYKGRHFDYLLGHNNRARNVPLCGYVINDETGCWDWKLSLTSKGYAQGRGGVVGHRFEWERTHGPVPEGMHLDHLCRNRACVNPDHLEVVTPRENVLRGIGITARNATATECAHGHPYDEENTYVRPNGARDCRACGRDRSKRYLQRKEAAA